MMQRNVFDESAWTFNRDRQQYFYHAYSEDEPDLNLTNPAVIAELDVSLLMLFCKGQITLHYPGRRAVAGVNLVYHTLYSLLAAS